MASYPLIGLFLIVFLAIFVDIFCGDISNSRQAWQNNQKSEQNTPEILASQNTTPWPTLGHRRRIQNPTRSNQPTTSTPKKWIQQNNIWIRQEQAASGGNIAPSVQNTTPKSQRVQSPRQTTPAQNVGSSTKKPLVRGQTYTVLDPQIVKNNKQQALIDGLGGNKQNLGPASPSSNMNVQSTPSPPLPSTTNKPISYSGAVSPPDTKKTNVPSPVVPSPQGAKKDTVFSTGPLDNVESLGGNQEKTIGDNGSGATDEELREFAEMLLRKDTNNAMKYVTLNLQGMTTSRSTSDEAPQPLLKVDAAVYKIPSIERIVLLYNNYFLEVSQNEVYTGQERIEENNLLDTLLATPVMQYARSFLIQKGKIGKDPREFRDILRQIWFNMYSRGQGRIGSSGFEHVFLGEIKNSQVSGLHNWLYFHEEEEQNRANYLGYMKKLDLGDKGAILKYHFTFHDIDKPVGSMFIGTSPELEIALYSTCFLLRADKICPLKMNGQKFIIRTFTYRYRGKNMIGSAFPEI